ncbi:Mobile element protein [Pseudomonas sp. R1-43-08]|nr:Mobile element protein [Pseudomonas sp. R1-43-08]
MTWSIATQSSRYKKHAKNSLIGRMLRKIEYAKAQVRAKVEHPFRVIKRQVTAVPAATKGKNRGIRKRKVWFSPIYDFLGLK